nr:unnamed protein product [Callosobruchus analis]
MTMSPAIPSEGTSSKRLWLSAFIAFAWYPPIPCTTVVDDAVLVKGLEKKKWLDRFISNRLIDLHDERCPNLEKLKTIFKS